MPQHEPRPIQLHQRHANGATDGGLAISKKGVGGSEYGGGFGVRVWRADCCSGSMRHGALCNTHCRVRPASFSPSLQPFWCSHAGRTIDDPQPGATARQSSAGGRSPGRSPRMSTTKSGSTCPYTHMVACIHGGCPCVARGAWRVARGAWRVAMRCTDLDIGKPVSLLRVQLRRPVVGEPC